MRNFEPMVHGAPGWDEQYNNDMGLLFGEMAGAKANSVLNTYIHAKNGKAHTLTGEGAVMRFLAKAPWTAGDTVTINGVAKNAITLEGTALPTGAFVAGMWVVAVVDGQKLQFLTQSYANTFAGIQTQLANKVNARPDETISLAELADEKYYPAGNENYLTKSPGGLVLVAINLRVNENQQIDHWERLFVLPEGYRTPKALSVCATLFSQPGGLLGFGALKQESNGEIWFVSGLSALDYATYIRGEMIYNVGQ